ncbi:putative histone acetyltransferase type B catalytic subunit [Apostasia shenzhenica]|uniref:Putative histone acetyltransferase type B catalytic subunit n=1 Tax=Apostasia shenzhenica TaxID=1088818 RepID=A0A2I0ANS8_9ASPA|nr:putative histone acetyltransferase type B catalytic subunit [Apostasia shenzhenica]
MFDGGKGITDLKPALENIFGEALVGKSEFLQTFSTESQCVRNVISNGAVLQCYVLKEGPNVSDTNSDASGSSAEYQVVRMGLHSLPVGLLYSRMVALTFLLIDGSSPIDVSDPQWDIYFSVKKIQKLGDYDVRILGFATVYRFYHHPDSTRLRLSQILVLPPYQGQGHGRCLLESVNSVAVAEGVYDLTIEEPSEYLQYLRSCIDTLRLLDFEPIKPAVTSVASLLKTGSVAKKASKSLAVPPTYTAEITRQKLKINKKQFFRCWDILLYISLDPMNCIVMQNFRSCISTRIKSDILDKDPETNGKHLIEVENNYDHDMTFVVYYCSQVENESDTGKVIRGVSAQEEQLNQLVDKQMDEIREIAKKVSLLRSS